MTKTAEKHIYFLDDEPQVRDVVKETLEEAGIKVTCFACASECLDRLGAAKCDLLITDLRMPEKDGLELLADVKRLVPWVPVLMITGYGDVPTAVKAIKGGATDFIEKPLAKQTFLLKVKSVLDDSAAVDFRPIERLTKAEMSVFRLVVEGKSNREIADAIHRSVRTVEVHRSHIMRKLGVDSLVDLLRLGAAMGLVSLQAHQQRGEPLPSGQALPDAQENNE